MLAYTGSFAFYTYISPLLLDVTHMSVGMASTMLLAYGVGAAIGNVFGGRLTDRQGMDRASLILLVGVAIILGLIGFGQQSPIAMTGLTALLGLTTYGAIPPLQSRILMLAGRHAPQAMDVASGMNIAAFNSGVVLGSLIGGGVIKAWGPAIAFLDRSDSGAGRHPDAGMANSPAVDESANHLCGGVMTTDMILHNQIKAVPLRRAFAIIPIK
ncbi:MFS transporter [Agrobacterium sp. LMR679]|uniref:MFS transporter n=1 Tax=Agrobacterium sp. LMR679 TaxID=3014335 RepID=UPI0022AFA2F5|nr:MFS transporter [Agrobacterium sp. LMR679]MCZ4072071.1 MFS transporter [Agrobacterium sp. LMR679]